jgi:hypothetical protein
MCEKEVSQVSQNGKHPVFDWIGVGVGWESVGHLPPQKTATHTPTPPDRRLGVSLWVATPTRPKNVGDILTEPHRPIKKIPYSPRGGWGAPSHLRLGRLERKRNEGGHGGRLVLVEDVEDGWCSSRTWRTAGARRGRGGRLVLVEDVEDGWCSSRTWRKYSFNPSSIQRPCNPAHYGWQNPAHCLIDLPQIGLSSPLATWNQNRDLPAHSTAYLCSSF